MQAVYFWSLHGPLKVCWCQCGLCLLHSLWFESFRLAFVAELFGEWCRGLLCWLSALLVAGMSQSEEDWPAVRRDSRSQRPASPRPSRSARGERPAGSGRSRSVRDQQPQQEADRMRRKRPADLAPPVRDRPSKRWKARSLSRGHSNPSPPRRRSSRRDSRSRSRGARVCQEQQSVAQG